MTDLADLYGDDLDAPPEGLDLRAANWWARRLVEAQDRVREVENRFMPEIEAISERFEAAQRTARKEEAEARSQLERIHRALLERDPKLKTVRLPHVTLEATHYKASVKAVNPDQLLAWVRDHAAEYLRTKSEDLVAWAELKRQIRIVDGTRVVFAGRAVDGVTVEPEHVTFKINPVPAEPF